MTYWPEVETVMARRFRWGDADCSTAACDLVRLVHGIDLMPELRGAYASAREAAAIMRRRGGLAAMLERAATAAGLMRGMAVPGAVGVHEGPRGASLVFCPAHGVWVGKSALGYVSGLICAEGTAWGR